MQKMKQAEKMWEGNREAKLQMASRTFDGDSQITQVAKFSRREI